MRISSADWLKPALRDNGQSSQGTDCESNKNSSVSVVDQDTQFHQDMEASEQLAPVLIKDQEYLFMLDKINEQLKRLRPNSKSLRVRDVAV